MNININKSLIIFFSSTGILKFIYSISGFETMNLQVLLYKLISCIKLIIEQV